MKIFFKKFFSIFLVFALFGFCFLYAHFEYGNLQIRNFTIESKDIPENFNGKKILFLADFQLDTSKKYNKDQMQKIINLVNSTEKDLILVGGDYTNYEKNIEIFFLDLNKINIPELGGFAVLGNHDYHNEEKITKNLENIGFKVLKNENKEIKIGKESIFISGIEDYWNGVPNQFNALKGIKDENLNIFITHNPDFFEKISEKNKKKIDLTLSGHTHGGQITFFGKVIYAPIDNIEKYNYGMKEFNGNKIYITSGVGGIVGDFFIRFFAEPEIVIFTLKKEI